MDLVCICHVAPGTFILNWSYEGGNNNNNFIVQFVEWKYILHFRGCIKTQYISHIVMHVYSKIKHVNGS